MTINAYNLIILAGAVHGFVLSFLLLVSKRNRRASNVLLTLVLIFYTLPVLRVVLNDLDFFRSYDLWFLSVELLYGLGPSIYLYCKTITNPQTTIQYVDLAHFLPVIVEIIYYFSPLFQQVVSYTFAPARSAFHLVWMVQQLGAIFSILIYLSLANRRLWNHRQWVDESFSNRNKRQLKWLSNPIILYTIFFVLWLGLRLIDVLYFQDSLTNKPYYPLLLCLSLITYWVGTMGYLEDQVEAFGFGQVDTQKEKNHAWSEIAISAVFEELETVMRQDKVYLDSDLSLSGLASHLQKDQRLISKVINTKAKMNFYDYINQYRVKEFTSLLQSDSENKTIISLAYESGFGSKATFNQAFKKVLGVTPTDFKKQYTAPFVKPDDKVK